ncbi:MAG: cytochrome c, partial [Saprospiraceae bacterium]|nr:cytochrome c [Saprospiraceae bacterium]
RDKLTAEVAKGKRIWESNNCMGCHTILGEGAYYAPELTKVVERRGEPFIRAVLQSPVPWAPNGRKMVAYAMNDEDTEAVIAYLKWIGEIDLNGFDRVVSPLSKGEKQ